jgi:hypothetical protein
MRRWSFWNVVPPGPLLSLLLVGLVLLSGLLYYRAVRIQRFMEPALALSQPRNDFSEAITQIVEKEFGKGPFRGLDVRTSSIVVDLTLLVSRSRNLLPAGDAAMKKFAHLLLALLEDKRTRPDISLILISAGYAPDGPGADRERAAVQRMLGAVQDALFRAEPDLKRKYRSFIAVAARPAPPRKGYPELMEFRIIPSEMLHMDVLQRLQKYAQ